MLENWGEMNKAQDNPQTIDQAIASAISAHEADPESHMGSGESIENHRINEVIDHPAGSVLTDKSTTSEIIFSHNFVPLTNYSVVGAGSYEAHQEWIAGVACYVEGSTSSLLIATLLPIYVQLPESDRDCLFQFNAQLQDGDVFIGNYGLFAKPAGTITHGFGFKIVNTSLYAFFVTSAGLTLSSVLTCNLNNVNQFRIMYNAVEKRCYFFINGSNVATITSSSTVPKSDSTRPYFLTSPNGASTFVSFAIFDWLFSNTI